MGRSVSSNAALRLLCAGRTVASVSALAIALAVAASANAQTVDINTGGTFTNTAGTNTTTLNNAGGTGAITGGTIGTLNNSAGTFTATGGTVTTANISGGAVASNGGTFTTVTQTGGTFANSGTIGSLSIDYGIFTQNAGGIITGPTTVNGNNFGPPGSGILNINGGTFTGGVSNLGGAVNVLGDFTGDVTNRTSTGVAQIFVNNAAALTGNLSNDFMSDVTVTQNFAVTGSISNSGVLSTAAGATLSATTLTNSNDFFGRVTNRGILTTTSGLTNSGNLVNELDATINGMILNSGGTLNNYGHLTGSVTVSGGRFTNILGNTSILNFIDGSASIAGGNIVTLNVSAIDRFHFIRFDAIGGTITAANLSGGSLLSFGGTIGTLNNTGGSFFSSAGTVANLIQTSGSFGNGGTVGSALIDGGSFTQFGSRDSQNAGGIVTGLASVGANGTLTINGGTFSGGVLNNGTVIVIGRLVQTGAPASFSTSFSRPDSRDSANFTGNITNNAVLNANGIATMTGSLINNGTGRLSVKSNFTVTGTLTNTGTVTVAPGTTLSFAAITNNAGGTITNAGTILGGVNNVGSLTSTGVIGTGILNSGTALLQGQLNGVLIGTGGTITQTGVVSGITQVQLTAPAVWNLAGFATSIDSLAGTGGSVQLGSADLITGTDNAPTAFGGVISGTGRLIKVGTGSFVLSGSNSYSGGTIITTGRLTGSTTSLQGAIQTSALLEFNQAAAGIFAGRISGTGTVVKTGAGLLELTGDNAGLTGATTLLGGELRVTSQLNRSVVTAATGSTLSGIGVVGGIIAQTGSTIAPGANGLGTLGVNGNVQFQTGATFAAQVLPQGADLIVANGTATLGGTLAVTGQATGYHFGSVYTLLQADQGRTGIFTITGLNQFSTMYRTDILYSANLVQVRFSPNLLSPVVAGQPLTANQRSVVSRIDSAVTNGGYNATPLTALYNLPTTQILAALNQLSGEVYASAARAALDDDRLVREAVGNRLFDTAHLDPDRRGGVWGQAVGAWGRVSSDGNAARLRTDTKGFVTGIETVGGNDRSGWRTGIFTVYLRNQMAIADHASSATLDRFGGGVYAQLDVGAVAFRTALSYAALDLDTSRTLAFNGFTDTTRAALSGNTFSTLGEIAWTRSLGNWRLTPFAQVTFSQVTLGSGTETGGASVLAIARQRNSQASASTGFRFAGGAGPVTVSGLVGVQAPFGNRTATAFVSLSAAPAQSFAVSASPINSVAGNFQLALGLRVSKSAELGFGYSGQLASGAQHHAARASFSVRF